MSVATPACRRSPRRVNQSPRPAPSGVGRAPMSTVANLMEVGVVPSGAAPRSVRIETLERQVRWSGRRLAGAAATRRSARGEGFGSTNGLVHLGGERRSRERRLVVTFQRDVECRTPDWSRALTSGSGVCFQAPVCRLAGRRTRRRYAQPCGPACWIVRHGPTGERAPCVERRIGCCGREKFSRSRKPTGGCGLKQSHEGTSGSSRREGEKP
jgi:hypothetical protein